MFALTTFLTHDLLIPLLLLPPSPLFLLELSYQLLVLLLALLIVVAAFLAGKVVGLAVRALGLAVLLLESLGDVVIGGAGMLWCGFLEVALEDMGEVAAAAADFVDVVVVGWAWPVVKGVVVRGLLGGEDAGREAVSSSSLSSSSPSSMRGGANGSSCSVPSYSPSQRRLPKERLRGDREMNTNMRLTRDELNDSSLGRQEHRDQHHYQQQRQYQQRPRALGNNSNLNYSTTAAVAVRSSADALAVAMFNVSLVAGAASNGASVSNAHTHTIGTGRQRSNDGIEIPGNKIIDSDARACADALVSRLEDWETATRELRAGYRRAVRRLIQEADPENEWLLTGGSV